MNTEEKNYYEKLEEGRARTVPVRNIYHIHPRKKDKMMIGIQPGSVGLISPAEYERHRYCFAKVSCPEWQSDGFKDGDPIKKKAKPATGQEAP